MFTLITVFIMKFLDCALGTCKTVFLCKNKFFISSVLNSLSAVLFIYVADFMANSQDDLKNYIAVTIFLANLAGGYLPPKILDVIEADKLFIYVITIENLEDGKIFADSLRELNIPVSTSIIYDKKINKCLLCKAYCGTKNESKIVDEKLKTFEEAGGKTKFYIVDAMS